MAISKTQRWLDLIAFLVKRRFPVPVDEIMEGVPAYREKWRTEDATKRASVRRMFERDKDELRAAGIPLETVEYSIEHGAELAVGYRLSGQDFYLPYLRIVGRAGAEAGAEAGGDEVGYGSRGRGGTAGGGGSEAGRAAGRAGGGPAVEVTAEEAGLAVEALRRVAELPASPFGREARSALGKLTFDLDPGTGRSPVLYADGGDTGEARRVLELLTAAVRRRNRVRFEYQGIHRGEATARDVAPYGLLYQHGQWYLIGHDATRDAIRVFRVGRMAGPAVERSGGEAEYEIPADFSVADYGRREPWELGDDEPLAVRVRFEFPLTLWAERNRHGEAVREEAGGAVVRRFEVRQTGPFLRWLQSFGGEAIVVDPAELRRAQAEMARATLAVYGDEGADG